MEGGRLILSVKPKKKLWKMGDSHPEIINGMLKVIEGIEFNITHLKYHIKLIQNRKDRDLLNAAVKLVKHGNEYLAHAMRNAK